ncbi:MAG: nucleoside deaminase [Lentimicrobiaceae bacterium]|jgi:tRNA(adenine34) deaminase|nr:nucleoside deaminase [Lentimicrobiaceae bacterium]
MEFSVFSDEHFMREALKQATLAAEHDEVPIGAVIVSNNKIIAKSHNQTELLNDITAHAEILAITSASNFLGAKYLIDCTLYVTLEPCPMCAGALFHAHISRIVWGADDEKRGFNRFGNLLHPKTTVTNGVLKDECKKKLTEFFNKKH